MLLALREILRKTAHSLGIESAMRLAEVQAAWMEVVGPGLAAASEPRSLRGGVLVVAAAHALAAQEVSLRREGIVRELQRRAPQAAVRRVRVVVRVGSGGGERRVPRSG